MYAPSAETEAHLVRSWRSRSQTPTSSFLITQQFVYNLFTTIKIQNHCFTNTRKLYNTDSKTIHTRIRFAKNLRNDKILEKTKLEGNHKKLLSHLVLLHYSLANVACFPL